MGVPLVNASWFNSQPDGTVTVTITNPLPFDVEGVGVKGAVLPGDSGAKNPDGSPDEANRNPRGPNCVLSMQPDGTAGARKPGSAGGYEKAKPVNGLLQYAPLGSTAPIVVVPYGG